MWVAAQLLQRAVTEQDRPHIAHKILSTLNKQRAPLMRLVQRPEVIALTQQNDPRFVKQGEHIAAARSRFAVRVDTQRDVGCADGTLGIRESKPDQRVHDVVQAVRANDQLVVFDDPALKIDGTEGACGRRDEAGDR